MLKLFELFFKRGESIEDEQESMKPDSPFIEVFSSGSDIHSSELDTKFGLETRSLELKNQDSDQSNDSCDINQSYVDNKGPVNTQDFEVVPIGDDKNVGVRSFFFIGEFFEKLTDWLVYKMIALLHLLLAFSLSPGQKFVAKTMLFLVTLASVITGVFMIMSGECNLQDAPCLGDSAQECVRSYGWCINLLVCSTKWVLDTSEMMVTGFTDYMNSLQNHNFEQIVPKATKFQKFTNWLNKKAFGFYQNMASLSPGKVLAISIFAVVLTGTPLTSLIIIYAASKVNHDVDGEPPLNQDFRHQWWLLGISSIIWSLFSSIKFMISSMWKYFDPPNAANSTNVPSNTSSESPGQFDATPPFSEEE